MVDTNPSLIDRLRNLAVDEKTDAYKFEVLGRAAENMAEVYAMLSRVVMAYRRSQWTDCESEEAAVDAAHDFLYCNDVAFKARVDAEVVTAAEARPLSSAGSDSEDDI